MRKLHGVGDGVAVATLSLGACGDGAPAAETSPTSSTDAASTDPTPTDATTAKAATGAKVTTETYTLRVPEGYRVSTAGATVTATGPDGDRMNFATVPLYADKSLRQLVAVAVDHGSWDREPGQLPNVFVDGVEMYHLSGPAGVGVTRDEVGAQVGSTLSYADFDLQGSATERREVLTSVLGTWRWR